MSQGADETPVAGMSTDVEPDDSNVDEPRAGRFPLTSGPARRWIGVVGALVAVTIIAAVLVGQRNGGQAVESTMAATISVTTTPQFPTTTERARPNTTNRTTSTIAARSTTTIVPAATAPPQDVDAPAVVARPVPVDPPPPPPSAPRPPWADSTSTTSAGLLSTDVGCADDTSAAGLDRFFSQRVGPVLGWDYQHVVSLGARRSLWLFQDTFIDHSGTASTLDKASFAHNVALIETDGCFSLLHQGTTTRPAPFEQGTGTSTLSTWFWPMGGEVHNGQLHVVWVKMVKDRFDPRPPDGLGWHPTDTFIATYDPETMARLDFRRAPNSGVAPIYGYAMVSDATHTYLFGNTFEQNLSREGGYWNGPHSATLVFLARVPRGRLFDPPEYRTADGWSTAAAAAVPILSRHWAEFPFQPRLLDGQWVGVAAVDGYWAERYSVDVANVPWGPWTTIEERVIAPRNADPKMNTYHAHLLPFRDPRGELVVTISNNARDMLRDAWPRPDRYRPMVFTSAWAAAPAPPTTPPRATTTTAVPRTTTTLPPTTTTSTTSTTTTLASTTTTSTTTTSTTIVPTTTTTSTTTTSSTQPGPD